MASLLKLIEFVGFPPHAKVSICRDLLGFTAARPPGALFGGRPAARVSMNEFVRSFRRQHFHVRIINTGADVMSPADNDALDYAVYRLRDIYVNAGIGVGLILRQSLTAANSKGHAAVRSEDDIKRAGADLTNDFPFIDASGRTVDGDRTALPVVVLPISSSRRPTPTARHLTVNPADLSIDELESAARGKSLRLTAPMAVVVLRAKLSHQAAVQRLLRIAETSEFDLRAREAAIQQLSEIPETRDQLQRLTQSADEHIASLARQTLRTLDIL